MTTAIDIFILSILCILIVRLQLGEAIRGFINLGRCSRWGKKTQKKILFYEHRIFFSPQEKMRIFFFLRVNHINFAHFHFAFTQYVFFVR